MNKYKTGNPIGRSSPMDLYDNASNLDEAKVQMKIIYHRVEVNNGL